MAHVLQGVSYAVSTDPPSGPPPMPARVETPPPAKAPKPPKPRKVEKRQRGRKG